MSEHAPTPWSCRDVSGAGLQISAALPAGFELGGGAKVMGEGRTEFMLWTLRDSLMVQIADERWVQFSSGSWEEMQKANAEVIVKAVNSHEALVDLVQTLLDNDPGEPIADNGMTVLDGWRDRARQVLSVVGTEKVP